MRRFRMNVLSFVRNESQGPEVDRPNYMIADNICAGGVFLKTDSPLDLDTRVRVDFFLVVRDRSSRPKKRVSLVEVGGKVIRIEKGGMAVQFDSNYRIRPFKENDEILEAKG